MRHMEHPNRRTGPVIEHLGEHEQPTKEDEPMEQPDEVHQLEDLEETEYDAGAPQEEPKEDKCTGNLDSGGQEQDRLQVRIPHMAQRGKVTKTKVSNE